MTEAPTLAFGAWEAAPAAARPLPRPTSRRFQPLRAGIFNLWQFERQELWFEGGRLILRGENGAGKSKALELLLPFLFDADLSPQRLDPFASTARNMSWNLLEESFESRLGYVWLELGRLASDGGEVFLTLGCGLKASRRSQSVDSWYFLTRQRPGSELELMPDRQPRSKEQLRLALGEAGQVFERGKDYRHELDARLFKLGDDGFLALRNLLLQLRRPHLSEKLDPESLSSLLAESLPPLDDELVGSVSESFERLEKDHKELAAVAASVAAVKVFLEVYRDYARGVTRARAQQVRSADHRFHDTAAQVRKTEAEREQARTEHEDLSGQEVETERALTTSQGALAALEQSEAMQQASTLAAKRDHTTELQRIASRDLHDHEREQQAAKRSERERAQAALAAEEIRRAAETEAEVARHEAARVGLEAAHAAAAEALAGETQASETLASETLAGKTLAGKTQGAPEPDFEAALKSARGTVEAALGERRRGVEELSALHRACAQARARFDGAEGIRSEASARSEAARERREKAETAAERRREELVAALELWREELVELPRDDAGFLLLLALLEEEEVGNLAAAVQALAAGPRDRLVALRTALAQETEQGSAEQAEVLAHREHVVSAREVPPESPRTRAADRAGRPGAPFYQLCEPAPGLAEAEAAGLEAALEAAGLLDAWVSPGGALLDPLTLDTRLVPTPRNGPGTLADLLRPAPAHGVSEEEIAALLASVDWEEGEGSPAGRRQRVGTDGRFALGPLSGAWAKPRVEHLGANAREAARLRRLAELDLRLVELEHRLELLAERRGELAGRLKRLGEEVERLPDTAALARALAQARAERADEGRRLAELGEAERQVAEARKAREAAEARLAGRARELRLSAFVADLDGYREALRAYQAAAESWLRGRREAERSRRLLAEAEARSTEARERRDEAEQRAARAGESAARAASEVRTLEATVGVEVLEVVARRDREKARLEGLRERQKRLRDQVAAARETLARLDERHRLKSDELHEKHGERDQAVFEFQRLALTGLLALATEKPPAEPPKDWTLTRSLELARTLEGELSQVDLGDAARNRRGERLYLQLQTLTVDLGGELQPSLQQEEELLIVRVLRAQTALDPLQLLALLADEEATRRELLAKEERELLLRFLLGEIGDHLRQLLRQARELVDEMNTQLNDCATASGMTLRLDWKPLDDAEAGSTHEIVPLLSRGPEMLTDAERARLQGFFHARIVAAREQWQAVPWREHLVKTLDYRRWHGFRLKRKEPGKSDWSELTKKSHAASSGGEKAVALHLPLFAAAAAHYRSADPASPRLILLDEAFAGIDEGMRGRLMALLVRFDLDFMMTSHDEWGCYRELPGVATYHLTRDPAQRGVLAVRFVWNGERLVEDEAGER